MARVPAGLTTLLPDIHAAQPLSLAAGIPWQGVDKLGLILGFDFERFNTLGKSCLLTYNICPEGGDR